MSKKIEVKVGQKFGSWETLKELPVVDGIRKFLVRCECGVEKEHTLNNLTRGKTTQCQKCALTKHGDNSSTKRSRLYQCWANMKRRPKRGDPNYDGIKVCKKWKKSYITFKKWALAHGYTDSLKLDREDNEGDYKPSNCRWVNQAIQSQNTRLLQRNNTSGYRGVTKNRKKWLSQITHRSKNVRLGSFELPEEAARAFDDYVKRYKLHQPLNFPYGVVCTENIKDVVTDSDHMIHFVAEGRVNKKGSEFEAIDGDNLDTGYKVPLGPLKKQFKTLMKDYYEAAEIESLAYKWKPGKMHLIFSDPNGNFRFELYPDYKGNRPPKSKLFYRLRKWAHKKYGYAKGVEADDVVGYWARQGAIVISTDKDVFKGCPGIFYNSHHFHRSWVYTTKEEAYHFNLIQTLMGDSTDKIPGIQGMGKVGAETALTEDTWEKVVEIYENATKGPKGKKVNLGLTRNDAVLNRRLVCLNQWSPEGGLKLFAG